MSTVKRVDELLNIEVKSDIKAASITASITPLRPTGITSTLCMRQTFSSQGSLHHHLIRTPVPNRAGSLTQKEAKPWHVRIGHIAQYLKRVVLGQSALYIRPRHVQVLVATYFVVRNDHERHSTNYHDHSLNGFGMRDKTDR
ncbi:hypothetical protein BpHYR1_012913 [Brachionus plicatilis]|uniref:Uncharacterized protein n=1 Tax=Brachionus plicatilis TaxID=10195 RepID=A0A3M7P8C8_BRAPC|nr:hypothetical protein BpHYR1_012913 [Brachionus plicatilis]